MAIFSISIICVFSQNVAFLDVRKSNEQKTPQAEEHISQIEHYENIIRIIRRKLPTLVDAQTGAIDATGKYVDTPEGIQGLNCAGFAKFIADGFYAPIRRQQGKTDLYMSVSKLRQRYFDLRGDEFTSKWEWERDPYFGLDWTRNIASQLGQLRENTSFDHEAFDVRDKSVWKYSEDTGYPTEYVQEILEKMAKEHPNRWYLASVNSWYGHTPELWQHHHIICLFPYYDKKGMFHCVVFERNNETSLASVLRRFPGSFLHLVWLSAEGDFQL